MENIVMMVTIGERHKSEVYLKYFKDNNINMCLGTYGRGTAKTEVLQHLGIGGRDKCVIFCFTTLTKSKEILKQLETKMQMRKIGVGLSFTVPLSAIASKKSLEIIAGNVDDVEGVGYSMEGEKEVIVVISNRGYSDIVMDGARAAGASGGTVIHARGTGIENAEKFFGTTIGAEKEMIFIVAKSEDRINIMKAIKEKNISNQQIQAVCFSLPITDVSGFIE